MERRKWQKWRKIKLYAKSGPLKSGDFVDNGKFGRRKWRKLPHGWRFKLDAKSGLLASGDFRDNGKNGNFGENGKKIWQKWRKSQRADEIWQILKLDAKWPLEIR